MKQEKKTKGNRSTWLILVASCGLGAIYCVVFLLPLRDTVADLQDQIKEKQQYVLATAQLPAAIQSMQQEVLLAEEYRNLWLEKAGTKDDFSEALGKLHGLIEREGLRTDRISPKQPKDMESVSFAEVTISLTGPFIRVVQFLNRVESMDEEIVVKSISIEDSGEINPLSSNREDREAIGDLAGNSTNLESGIVTCQATLVIFAGNNDNSDYASNED